MKYILKANNGSSLFAMTDFSVPQVNKTSGEPDLDIMDLVKEVAGLPSDANAIIDSIESLLSTKSVKSPSSIKSAYLSILRAINTAKFNQEEYKKTQTFVENNKGMNELAIDKYGRVMVLTENGYDQIDIQKYLKNPSKYYALTNKELLQQRSEVQGFNNNLLNVVSNGIGIEKVNDMYKDEREK